MGDWDIVTRTPVSIPPAPVLFSAPTAQLTDTVGRILVEWIFCRQLVLHCSLIASYAQTCRQFHDILAPVLIRRRYGYNINGENIDLNGIAMRIREHLIGNPLRSLRCTPKCMRGAPARSYVPPHDSTCKHAVVAAGRRRRGRYLGCVERINIIDILPEDDNIPITPLVALRPPPTGYKYALNNIKIMFDFAILPHPIQIQIIIYIRGYMVINGIFGDYGSFVAANGDKIHVLDMCLPFGCNPILIGMEEPGIEPDDFAMYIMSAPQTIQTRSGTAVTTFQTRIFLATHICAFSLDLSLVDGDYSDYRFQYGGRTNRSAMSQSFLRREVVRSAHSTATRFVASDLKGALPTDGPIVMEFGTSGAGALVHMDRTIHKNSVDDAAEILDEFATAVAAASP